MQALPTAGELVRGQVHDMEGIHDLSRLRERLVHCGGVAGKAIHGHYLHLSPELRAAFLQPGSQDLGTASRAHVQQPGRTCPGDQGCEVHQDRHERGGLAGAAGVLPHMLVDPEDAYAVQVGGVVVDQLAAGIDGDLVDQFPTHPEGLGGRRHAHPINRQALQDPAGDSVGELRTVIGAGQKWCDCRKDYLSIRELHI